MSKATKHLRRILLYTLIIAVCLATNLPLLSMLGTAFKPSGEVMANTSLFTGNPSLENFTKVVQKTSFPRAIANTCIIALFVVGFCVVFASMAGFAVSRARGKIFSGFTMLLLILQMIPGILVMIPLFSTLRALKLVDTHISLVLIYISTNLPFGILTMKGFFDSIPTDLDEAAMIDGASPYQTYWKIIFPHRAAGHDFRSGIYVDERMERVRHRQHLHPVVRTSNPIRRPAPVPAPDHDGLGGDERRRDPGVHSRVPVFDYRAKIPDQRHDLGRRKGLINKEVS